MISSFKNFNFNKGIYKISNNSIIDEDLERSGSFAQHLFEIIRLLIEIFDKTDDHPNLIDLSKAFYQRLEQERFF